MSEEVTKMSGEALYFGSKSGKKRPRSRWLRLEDKDKIPVRFMQGPDEAEIAAEKMQPVGFTFCYIHSKLIDPETGRAVYDTICPPEGSCPLDLEGHYPTYVFYAVVIDGTDAKARIIKHGMMFYNSFIRPALDEYGTLTDRWFTYSRIGTHQQTTWGFIAKDKAKLEKKYEEVKMIDLRKVLVVPRPEELEKYLTTMDDLED